MKKIKKFFFFAIIAMVAFSSACERNEKISDLKQKIIAADRRNDSIKRLMDSLRLRAGVISDSIFVINQELMSLSIENDIRMINTEVSANPKKNHYQPKVSGITVDWGRVNEIVQNRTKSESYMIKCDSICLSDHEWPIVETPETHLSRTNTPITEIARKPFSFHDIVTEPYDSIKFDRIYAGVLLSSNYLFKNSDNYSHLSGRVAFSLSVHPEEIRWVDFEGGFSFDLNEIGNTDVGLKIQYNFHPVKWVTISTGFLPQIPTMSRPDFVSEEGQNEFYSEALLPANTLGVNFKFHPWDKGALPSGESCSIQTGVFLDGWNHYSAQIGVDAPFEENFKMQYAFWVTKLGGPVAIRGIGMSLKYDMKYMSILCTFANGGINQFNTRESFNGGGVVKVPLFWTNVRSMKNMELMCDVVYNNNTYHWTHFECGAGWKFSTKYVGGLFGATYDPYNNSLTARVLVYTK